jgi:hypothetical protein
MKSRYVIIATAAAIFICFTGCGQGEGSDSPASREALVKALDKSGFENAPTLGPVFRNFLLAVHDKNYGIAWGMLTKPSQAKATDQLTAEIVKLRKRIDSLQAQIDDPATPQGRKEWCQAQVDLKKDRLSQLTRLTAEAYFAALLNNADIERNYQDIATGKVEIKIAGETINGDKGVITGQNTKEGKTLELRFVLEGGAWKFDFYNTSAPKPPAPETGGGAEPATAPAGNP